MGRDIHMFVEMEVKLSYAPSKTEFVLIGLHNYGGRDYKGWDKMDDKANFGLPDDKSWEVKTYTEDWGLFGFRWMFMKDFYKKIKHAETYLPMVWDKKAMKKMRVIWAYDN